MDINDSRPPVRNRSVIRKAVIAVLALAVFAAVLVGADALFNAGRLTYRRFRPVKIVLSTPLRKLSTGIDMANGAALAFEQAGYRAGGRDIQLIKEDDGDENGIWQGSVESAVAVRAAADPDVLAYIGPMHSGAAEISIPILNRAGLVQVSTENTYPGLTLPGYGPGEPDKYYPSGVRNYFRVCPNDALQAPAAADWAKSLEFKKIFILDDGELYGKGIADIFRQEAEKRGFEVLGQITIDKDGKDFTKVLTRIKSLKPDLVYFGGLAENGSNYLIRDFRSLGFSARFMGSDGLMLQDFIDSTGQDSEGVLLTIVGVPPENLTGPGKEFYDTYVRRYGKPPSISAALSYEAAKAVIAALDRSGAGSRAAMLKAVAETRDFNGIFGRWSFDGNGDTSLKLISGYEVKGGKFEFIKIIE